MKKISKSRLLTFLCIILSCVGGFFLHGTLDPNNAGAMTMPVEETAYAIGDNSYGQLGIYDVGSESSPTAMYDSDKFSKIVGGSDFTVALDPQGNVWAWGSNFAGQLGAGVSYGSDFDGSVWPVEVEGISHVIDIAVGGGDVGNEYDTSFVLALRADGTVWAWGDNEDSQLGIGENGSELSYTATPTEVVAPDGGDGYLTNIVSLAASPDRYSDYEYQMDAGAVRSDGTVWMWGLDEEYQLGNEENSTDYDYPVQVDGISNAKELAIGEEGAYALESDGSVWA